MTPNGPAHHSPQFEASFEERDGVAVVHARGEVDIATAPLLSEVLREASADGAPLLVADLAGVTLLDSTGLGALIEHLGQLREQGGRTELRLVVVEPQVKKVLAITGLDQIFSIFASIEEAIALAV